MKHIFPIAILLMFGTLLFIPHTAQAQRTDQEIMDLLASAKASMANGMYAEANTTFRKMLALNQPLPTEMTYLFAETLFHLGQHQNSKNFLEKYLSLTGRNADHYEQAMELLELIDEEKAAILACARCNAYGYRLKPCFTCAGKKIIPQQCDFCQGKGIITCQKCLAQGVLITRGPLGERTYKACDHCAANGYHTCNKCNGAKFLESQCVTCRGAGDLPTNKVCDHQAEHLHDH